MSSKHGYGGNNERRRSEYKAWDAIKQRCLNPNDERYPSYGGRGITVCEEWLSFNNFIQDMGNKPSSEHSIERINNNEGYYKDNCRWALRIDQANNTRRNVFVCVNGEYMTFSQACCKYNIKYNTAKWRLRMGRSIEEAFGLISYSRLPYGQGKGR